MFAVEISVQIRDCRGMQPIGLTSVSWKFANSVMLFKDIG